ncbi:hypothetical protein L1049_018776 [Liquidambar formosana]|uniref:F-box domain-containing protein n=1 Tax=Liquidambar formosana TaxID=63359 RepID=A0AAP0RAJ6_LIQFO
MQACQHYNRKEKAKVKNEVISILSMASILQRLFCLSEKTTVRGSRKRKEKKKSLRNTKNGGDGSISKVPRDILIDVFSRLPVKTIFACRCVCNSWRHILLDPRFASVRLSRKHGSLLIIRTFFHICPQRECYMVEFKASNIASFIKFNPFHSNPRALVMVNSCNGLLCFTDRINVYINNPIAGESMRLPQGDIFRDNRVFGLGFN